MIRRSISTNLMLTTLQTLGVFTLIWVMTGGGPGTDSSTLPVLAYQEAFKFAQVGYGTAIATVTLLVGAVFSLVYIRVLKPEVD
jgi:multiple sugar transport system permease protein